MAASNGTQQTPIAACLFDMDGLLLDTETSYTLAQQQIVQRYGKTFTWELKAKMMGRRAIEAAQLLVTELQIEEHLSAQEFLTEREQILDAMFATAALLPGAEKLIRHLHQHRVPIALATSSHTRHFDLKTTLHRGLFALFDCVVTGDQVTKGKPAPDIFLLAMQQLQQKLNSRSQGPTQGSSISGQGGGQATGQEDVPSATTPATPATPETPATAAPMQQLVAERCLVFEDAPSGVEAALAAGMKVVMVPDPNLDAGQRGRATQELSSLELFDPAAWGLPPFPQ